MNYISANKQLVGKIKNEHSLFFDGQPNDKMQTTQTFIR